MIKIEYAVFKISRHHGAMDEPYGARKGVSLRGELVLMLSVPCFQGVFSGRVKNQ